MTLQFETKDSGVREVYDNGMQRDTQEGKARFDLMLALELPYEAQLVTRIGHLLARGAKKYGERNWESGWDEKAYARAKASAMHHLVQWVCKVDDGEDHAAAVFFNLMQAEYLEWMRPETRADYLTPAEIAAAVALTADVLEEMPVGTRVRGVIEVSQAGDQAGDVVTLTRVDEKHWDNRPGGDDGGYWTSDALLASFSDVRVIA